MHREGGLERSVGFHESSSLLLVSAMISSFCVYVCKIPRVSSCGKPAKGDPHRCAGSNGKKNHVRPIGTHSRRTFCCRCFYSAWQRTSFSNCHEICRTNEPANKSLLCPPALAFSRARVCATSRFVRAHVPLLSRVSLAPIPQCSRSSRRSTLPTTSRVSGVNRTAVRTNCNMDA